MTEWIESKVNRVILSGANKIVEMLISHGADVNAKNYLGTTPREKAYRFGMNWKCVLRRWTQNNCFLFLNKWI